MASELKLDTQLQLLFETGIDHEGEVIIKRKNFNQVNTEVDATALYTVANSLANLQKHPLHQIVRNNSYNIQN
ncbi:DUF1659 domain-containing protein [Allobacillus sp. GCM10007491]|uniref:DUF1659 domain-containing protein n=1 Tax=Allobacillus saliphilus TaxID=2912308 RepID=A0A941CUT2_9BACI|nr:DUF1659 domain-containing protein [Allobacillus saliphilus]MBR7553506.1 DUF1659 domain-containing protein [Allobacillus saliphilus]